MVAGWLYEFVDNDSWTDSYSDSWAASTGRWRGASFSYSLDYLFSPSYSYL